jgi:hypothetical protein
VLCEGARYQDLVLASQDLEPRAIANSQADGLDGWSFLMRTPARDFALAYFENRAARVHIKGMQPHGDYRWGWFDPRTGEWSRATALTADANGVLKAPPFAQGGEQAARDVAARIVSARRTVAAAD